MIYQLAENWAKEYMSVKIAYDTVNKAIKLARVYGADDNQCGKLIAEKQSLNARRMKLEQQMHSLMAPDSNLMHIEGSWWVILYLDDKNQEAIKVEILREKDIHLIERNPAHSLQRRKALDDIIPACLDHEALEEYKKDLETKAYQLLHSSGIDVPMPEGTIIGDDRIIWSVHSRSRYAQRVLGIKDEKQADAYQRAHASEIEDALDDAFGIAELLWTADDGIQYWIDPNNYTYVVSPSNICVTMYEMDFGFTKDINRTIVFEQIKVIGQAHQTLAEAQNMLKGELKEMDEETSSINSEMAVLKAQLDHLEARHAELIGKRNVASKGITVLQEQFNKESNKLFKKWES